MQNALRRRICCLTHSLFVLAGVCLAVPVLHAREYAPCIVSPYHADAYSMKILAQFPRWRERNNNARAWEVYRYLVDPQTGLFPLGQGAE
ncbi:MAG: hypothetical protein ACRELF_23105 [Gemmataceae bacterium]